MKPVRRTVTGSPRGRTKYQLLGSVTLATMLGACGGGSSGTTGASNDWAEWPMPNGPTDVAAGAPNPESYTVNGDGTVTDNVTGLMWQQTVSTTLIAWSAAVASCPTLTLGRHTDWRLPTEIELISLVDFSDTEVNGDANAAINVTAFPNAPPLAFWSSTPLVASENLAWTVDFDFNGGHGASSVGAAEEAVRCVR